MPVTEIFAFDVEKFLSPVAGENPAGELLRYEGTYDQIREARREEEPNLNQGVWQRDLKKADWQAVSDLCLAALENRSKDLQLAAWLLESWLHLYGFAGVREGLKAVNALCWRFWEVMHPTLDDPEYRVAIFNWIDAKLSLQLKFVPITEPLEGSGASSYSWSDWEAAFHLEQAARQHRQMKETGQRVTLAIFQQSAAVSPPSFFQCLRDDLASDLEACGDLEKFLDGTYGEDAPSLRTFREALQAVQGLVQQILGEREPSREVEFLPESAEAHAPILETGAPEAPVLTPSTTAIHSREEAFRTLREVADFLQAVEPHSPVPYLIRRAISWGGMTLEELLPELIRNDQALADTFKTLQIQNPK
jgi:type VI secretion system protein ImpA